MRLRQVCFLVLGLAGLTVLASVGIGGRNHPPRAAAAEPKETKLKALLKERHALLQKLAAASERFRIGQASMAEVIEANRAALKAELDLCDTDRERVAVLERMLADARENEKSVKEGVEAARVPGIELLRATAGRLDIEIALERAKAK